MDTGEPHLVDNGAALRDVADPRLASSAAICLERARWQQPLFTPFPTRRSVQALAHIWPVHPIRIRVHRNHAFEPVESVLRRYLAFAGYAAEFIYSQYDDSLSFDECEASPPNADEDGPAVELIWLDVTRHVETSRSDDIAQWVGSRLAVLRQRTTAPLLVLIAAHGSAEVRAIDAMIKASTTDVVGVFVCDQQPIHEALGDDYFDSRAALLGTRLSNAACVHTARYLGAVWIPAALAPRLKAIVLDLDDTLYGGAVAEEGIEGVRLTADHVALQRRLLELWSEGILLSVCSKNEPADVCALFDRRTDFPLGVKHLSALEVGWGPKHDGIHRISELLRVGTESMLFVDDNPGQLSDAASRFPDLKTLYAGPRTADVLHALAYFPGLYRWHADEADILRATDLAVAETRRDAARAALDAREYFKTLDIQLRFACDRRLDLKRVVGLSGKTNQFNLALRRFSAVDVARFMSTSDHTVVSVRLRDRLSDSGLVGALFLRRDGETVYIEETCISCRALGRRLEDAVILGAIRFATRDSPPTTVRFRRVRGARNTPAMDWLSKFTGGMHPHDEWVSAPWNLTVIENMVADLPVTLEYDLSISTPIAK